MTDRELQGEGRAGAVAAQPPSYLTRSRSTVNALILATPLFVLYQIGILFTDGWKNALDFVTSRLYQLVGESTELYLVVNLAVLAAILIIARFIDRDHQLRASTWLLVLAESAVYAILLGGVINRILHLIGFEPTGLSLSPMDNLVLSMGAGAYEELVFRLLLISLLLWIGKRLRVHGVWLWLAALLVSSVLFSAAHYTPFGSDAWEVWSFAYRFVAGLIFAGLFLLRGFAVAAYSHAFYDVGVLVL